MSRATSRRKFIQGMGAAVAAGLTASIPVHALVSPGLLYPPIDLSYFNTPVSSAPAEFRLGYAAITWSGNDRQAIDDISGLGFRGIQLRANALQEFHGAAAHDSEDVAEPDKQPLQRAGRPHGHIEKEHDDNPRDGTALDFEELHSGGRWRAG